MFHGCVTRRVQSLPWQSAWLRRTTLQLHRSTRPLIAYTQAFTEAEDDLIIQRRRSGRVSFQAIAKELDRAPHVVRKRFRNHLVQKAPDLLETVNRRYRPVRPFEDWENELIISERKAGRTLAALAEALEEQGSTRSPQAIQSHIYRRLVKDHPTLNKKTEYDATLCDAIQEGYKAGKTMQQIMRETGSSQAVIAKHAHFVSAPAKRSPSFSGSEINCIIEMRGQQESWGKISEKLDRPISSIQSIYKEQRTKWEATHAENEVIQRLRDMGVPAADIAEQVDLPLWLVRREMLRLKWSSQSRQPARGLRKYQRWTEATRQKVLELRRNGRSIKYIAAQVNASVGKVSTLLAALPDHILNTLPKRRLARRYTKDEIQRIVHLRSVEGLTWKEVAKQIPGTTESRLSRMFMYWYQQGALKGRDRQDETR